MADFRTLVELIFDKAKARSELNSILKELQKGANLKTEIKVGTSDAKKAKKDLNETATAIEKIVSESRQLSKINTVKTWADNNTKAMKMFGDQIQDIITKMGKANLSLSEFKGLDASFNKIKIASRDMNLLGKTWGDSFRADAGKFASWLLPSGGIMAIINGLRKMKDSIVDIDTAMTNLYKVSDETDSKYRQFLQSSNVEAQRLGRTVSSLIEQTATWKKLGFTTDESSELAKISSIYANVGEVSDDTAVSDLVTAMKAFNIESSKSITIVDSLNKLGNEFATDAGSLGEGLKNAASALALGGMDINKSLALLTGGSEITQNAGELGNALKVGQMRVMGMKGALEQLGEESEGLESISKIQTHILNITKGQVNIMNEADPSKFKDYYDILESVSRVYFSLKQTDQADLLETLFGKQRGNQGAAILQAFQSGQVQKALEASMNSTGSAYEEQSKWMESIDAKTQQYEASFQSLSQTVLNSNFLKFLIDSGTTFNNVLDKTINGFGVLSTTLSGAGIAAFIKNYG